MILRISSPCYCIINHICYLSGSAMPPTSSSSAHPPSNLLISALIIVQINRKQVAVKQEMGLQGKSSAPWWLFQATDLLMALKCWLVLEEVTSNAPNPLQLLRLATAPCTVLHSLPISCPVLFLLHPLPAWIGIECSTKDKIYTLPVTRGYL